MSEPAITTPRERYEQHQRERLAPCAVGEDLSGGRRHAEDEHPYRTCFQRDRDRVMHSAAFRRLDFKTQVFVPHEHDHFRTRLTHSLEVSQVSRDVARALAINEDLVEAVALAHDLGHSPFGHAGEAALHELMADHGGFEHNAQALRIVDYLEHPYPRFRGLNLTRVTRECIIRHETRYDAPAGEEFEPGLSAPLEGQVVDLADEIAYTAADLEDSLASSLIDAEQLQAMELWRRAWQRAEARDPDARHIHKRIRACKAVVSVLADDLIETTLTHLDAMDIDSPQAVRHAKHKCAALSAPMREALDQTEQFLLDNVYTCGENDRQNRLADRIIRELFGAYLARPELLPERYRKRSHNDGLHRVTCDYIAGMTDRFCRMEHRRVCGG